MRLLKKLKMTFGSKEGHDFVAILSQQTEFLCRTTAKLVDMLGEKDYERLRTIEKEISECEVQGDALLTEFHEQLSAMWFVAINKLDLQAVSMALDDCLDAIKDTSKALLIYKPSRIDPQLVELANLAKSQSEALHDMIPLLSDISGSISSITLCCDRVTELEHAADEFYEDYIGYIFTDVDDTRELIKYKNIAEMLENTTDVHKRISDNVRKLLLNYLSK